MKRQRRIPNSRRGGHAEGSGPPAPSGLARRPQQDRGAKPARPTTIFKYGQISPQNLANLEARGVCFASPLNFDDPYDCALAVGLVDLGAEDVEAMSRRYVAGQDVPAYLKLHFLSISPGELKDMAARSMRSTLGTHQ